MCYIYSTYIASTSIESPLKIQYYLLYWFFSWLLNLARNKEIKKIYQTVIQIHNFRYFLMTTSKVQVVTSMGWVHHFP